MIDEETIKDPGKLSLGELIEICGQAYKEYAGENKRKKNGSIKLENRV